MESIAALHPAFLRFPGGCIVEGVTPGNEYRWKDTIGSLPARRQQYSMWSFKMPDGSSYSQSCQIGVYFGEYSANGHFAGQPQTEQNANTWKSALGEAAVLTGCERNSDVVRMTSYAPLLAHIPAKGWAQNLIEFNPAHVNPTLNYEVERLFSAHLGETAYQVSVEQCAAARHLYVSATGHDGNGSCRYIKIVNTSGSPVDVTLEIARGLTGLGGMRQESNDSDAAQRNLIRLEVETLSANPQAKTTLGYRGKASGTILPKQRNYTLPSPSSLFAMKIEPYSVTLVTSR